MMSMFRKLWTEEEGQTLVEYALIIALIAITAIAAMKYLSGRVQTNYSSVGNELNVEVPTD
jgi:pilus assembly protein Flp/PilA